MRKVLALKREDIHPHVPNSRWAYAGYFDNHSNMLTWHNERNLKNNLGVFIEKARAESDESFKQVIGYVLVRSEKGTLLTYTRTTLSGETRLHGAKSIGIGGHVEESDGDGLDGDQWETLKASVRRELAEELGISGDREIEFIGVVNDNSTEVNRVHLGFVFSVTVNDDEKLKFGEEIANPAFLNLEHIADGHLYEKWSRSIISVLDCTF